MRVLPLVACQTNRYLFRFELMLNTSRSDSGFCISKTSLLSNLPDVMLRYNLGFDAITYAKGHSLSQTG